MRENLPLRWIVMFAILFVITGPFAAEIILTDEEKVKCADEGGCGMVSYAWIKKQVQDAFERGKVVCNSST